MSVAHRPDPEAIRAQLAKELDSQRYAHVASTARLAAELAPQVGVSPQRAYLAGLLHDCARSLPPARLAGILEGYRGRFLDSHVLANPSLWHTPASVYLAFHKYCVTDPEILRAIGRHSTGAPHMRPLDKVIYVADYTEPLRTQADAGPLRELARRDLEAAFRRVVRAKVDYLRTHGIEPHPVSLALDRELGIPISRAKARDRTREQEIRRAGE